MARLLTGSDHTFARSRLSLPVNRPWRIKWTVLSCPARFSTRSTRFPGFVAYTDDIIDVIQEHDVSPDRYADDAAAAS